MFYWFCVLSCGATELTLSGLVPPWQRRAAGGFELQYDGKGYPEIMYRAQIRKNAFYRLSFSLEAPVGSSFGLQTKLGTEVSSLNYPGRSHPMKCTEYFFSGDFDRQELRFHPYPKPQSGKETFIVDRVDLEEILESSLKENLMVNGDFESNDGLAFWGPNNNRAEDFSAVLSPSPEFFAGKQSLKIVFDNSGPRSRITSRYLPLVPGQTVALRFWAKADQGTTLTAVINAYSRKTHQGKHLREWKSFQLNREWQEYEVTFAPGSDFATAPDLKERLVKVQFFPPPNGSGTIWLDNIEYRIIIP